MDETALKIALHSLGLRGLTKTQYEKHGEITTNFHLIEQMLS